LPEHEVSFTFSLYDRGYLISKSASVSSLLEIYAVNFVTTLAGIVFLEFARNTQL